MAAIVGDLVDCEAMVVLKELMAAARIAASRLPPGRRQARCRRALQLSLQHHDRRHRAGRPLPADRHQPALRGSAGQRPAAQALAPGRLHRGADRAAGRPDLFRSNSAPARARWPSSPTAPRVLQAPRAGGAADADRRPGRARAARRRRHPRRRARDRRALRHGPGRLERLQRPAHRGRAGRRSRPRPGARADGGRDVAGMLEAPPAARSRSSSCSAPTRSTSGVSAMPS